MTIRVAVADDQALVRGGFCGIIAATPGLTVVGEAGNGAEAVAVAKRLEFFEPPREHWRNAVERQLGVNTQKALGLARGQMFLGVNAQAALEIG